MATLRKLLRLPAVRQVIPYSPSTIYAKIAAGTFPPGVKISENITAWPEDEIIEYQAARIAARNDWIPFHLDTGNLPAGTTLIDLITRGIPVDGAFPDQPLTERELIDFLRRHLRLGSPPPNPETENPPR